MEHDEKLINELEVKMHKLLYDLGVKYPEKITIFPKDDAKGVYIEVYGNGEREVDRIRIVMKCNEQNTQTNVLLLFLSYKNVVSCLGSRGI